MVLGRPVGFWVAVIRVRTQEGERLLVMLHEPSDRNGPGTPGTWHDNLAIRAQIVKISGHGVPDFDGAQIIMFSGPRQDRIRPKVGAMLEFSDAEFEPPHPAAMHPAQD